MNFVYFLYYIHIPYYLCKIGRHTGLYAAAKKIVLWGRVYNPKKRVYRIYGYQAGENVTKV